MFTDRYQFTQGGKKGTFGSASYARTGGERITVRKILIGTASWTNKTLIASGRFCPPKCNSPGNGCATTRPSFRGSRSTAATTRCRSPRLPSSGPNARPRTSRSTLPAFNSKTDYVQTVRHAAPWRGGVCGRGRAQWAGLSRRHRSRRGHHAHRRKPSLQCQDARSESQVQHPARIVLPFTHPGGILHVHPDARPRRRRCAALRSHREPCSSLRQARRRRSCQRRMLQRPTRELPSHAVLSAP